MGVRSVGVTKREGTGDNCPQAEDGQTGATLTPQINRQSILQLLYTSTEVRQCLGAKRQSVMKVLINLLSTFKRQLHEVSPPAVRFCRLVTQRQRLTFV